MKQTDRITTAFMTLREQMLSLAERITGNRDDAADAVQDAFVKLTVRNSSIDLARRNSHASDIPVEQAADAAIETSNDETDSAYQQVRRIIDNELSPRQRAIIDMREIEEMEFEDIAKRLGMQPAAVRVELSRARKRVREMYHNRKKNNS